MEEKEIQQFEGKYVKLVRSNNFVLTGIIEMVYTDWILFVTPEERSLIRIDYIKEIVEKKSEVDNRK